MNTCSVPFLLQNESNLPNQGWWCLAFSITSAHSFLLFVSVFSLLYLYVSHITMMFFPPLMLLVIKLTRRDKNQPEGVRIELDWVKVGVRVGPLSLKNIWSN